MKSRYGFFGFIIISLIFALSNIGKVIAQSSSANYRVEESAFSSGSGEGTSASYSSRVSAGDLGIGFASSASYRAYAGPISPNEEFLEMIVTPATIDLGTLSDSSTASGIAMFSVRAYINSAYTVITLSPGLTSESSDTIANISTAAASSIGTEQFGINLVDNATPDIGANPAPQPDSNYANGEAATGYDTADQYQYNQGDTIAQNGGFPAWGQTNYTISYIVNIAGITEAGLYEMEHDLVAVTTF